jgi:hypothetical protein
MRFNPYLSKFEQTCKKFKDRLWMGGFYTARSALIHEYGFAVPDARAIQLITQLSPVVELGAGTGYWARVLQRYGCKIEAYDNHSGEYGFKRIGLHFPVKRGDQSVLENYGPEWALFLCWPCYESSFASDALEAFKGDTLIYIGEGMGGCTADDTFHTMLENDWTNVENYYLPAWRNVHDTLKIYKKG